MSAQTQLNGLYPPHGKQVTLCWQMSDSFKGGTVGARAGGESSRSRGEKEERIDQDPREWHCVKWRHGRETAKLMLCINTLILAIQAEAAEQGQGLDSGRIQGTGIHTLETPVAFPLYTL